MAINMHALQAFNNNFLKHELSSKVSVSRSVCVRLFATPRAVAHQTLLSMEFSRQEHWSGCHFFLQGLVLTQGSSPRLLHCRRMLHHLSCQGSQSISFSVVSDSSCLLAGAHQAPLPMEFLRQEYCSGLPFPLPGGLPKPEIEPGFPALQADSLLSESTGKPGKVVCP